VIERLVQAANRPDSDENNLRTMAYEAINSMISSGANDTVPLTRQLLPVFMNYLNNTFSMKIVSQEERSDQNELQALLCGVLQVITVKLGKNVDEKMADDLMSLYLRVFQSKNAAVHEEALLAVGSLANCVESKFEKYMSAFRPFLITGLKNYSSQQVCGIAVGVVNDVTRVLGKKIEPYCDEICSTLFEDLKSPNLNRDIRPVILATFGDIAMAIGGKFKKYLDFVMGILQQASQTQVDPNNEDLVYFLNVLRENIFEAYTGINHGLKDDGLQDSLLQYVEGMIQFAETVARDPNHTDDVAKAALGVIGDLCHSLGPRIKPLVQKEWVLKLINEILQVDDTTYKRIGNWAKQAVEFKF